MVFWSTLLAFTIGLMYYVLYPGDGKIKDVYMPASEAFVSGFLVQHQAAKEFARDAVLAIVQLTNFASGNSKVVSESGIPENSIIILTDDDDEKNMISPYIPNSNAMTEVGDFKPVPKPEEDIEHAYVSVLACFNMPERKFGNGDYVKGVQLQDCKSAPTKYVMTYGLVPSGDFGTPYTRGKTILWEAAILKRTHGSPDCGFLHYNGGSVEGKPQYFIHNSRRLTRNVPTAFTKALGNYIQHSGIGRAYNGDSETGSDIMFCMTPINDPYPRLGAKVLLDSKVNTAKDGTTSSGESKFKVTHSSTIPLDNQWVNLAGINEQPAITINSSGTTNDWFFSKCGTATNEKNNSFSEDACEAVENNNAFSFTLDRYFNVTPSGKSNKDFLGSSFTISMMMGFSGSGTIFKTQNTENTPNSCSPTSNTNSGTFSQQPCITARYEGNSSDDGHFMIEITGVDSTGNQLSADENSKLTLSSGLIMQNVPTQIDYIFNGAGHRLYINGQLADSTSFVNVLSGIDGLAGNTLIFGGASGTTSNLYNLIIYTREVSNTETPNANEKFDMYGLPRIYKSNTLRYKNN